MRVTYSVPIVFSELSKTIVRSEFTLVRYNSIESIMVLVTMQFIRYTYFWVSSTFVG